MVLVWRFLNREGMKRFAVILVKKEKLQSQYNVGAETINFCIDIFEII
jgi:hypothetical protein